MRSPMVENPPRSDSSFAGSFCNIRKNLFKVFLKNGMLLFHKARGQYGGNLSKRHQSRAV
jgi:hypothetical protein